METDILLEDLMSQLGDFGPYQLQQILLHLSATVLAGLHIFSLTTVAPTPLHRCFIPEVDAELNGTSPSLDSSLLADFIPVAGGKLESCRKYVPGTNGTQFQDCEGNYVYDDAYYHSSRVIDMGLVCDKRWIRALMQSVYMIGVLTGAVLLGSLADKWGRKRIFYASIVLQLIFGLSSAFIQNIYAYVGILFFYGMFGSAGAYVTGFVLTMEIVGSSKRTICGTAAAFAFSVGAMVVALWGSFIRETWILQTVYALHAALVLPCWWILDESIRWLWGQGRIEEALKIAEKGVKANGREFINRYSHIKTKPRQNNTKSSATGNLFKSAVLRNRMLNMAFCWFANSLVYYGLSLNAGELLGNPFLMLFLLAIAEAPAHAAVILFMNKTGRRSMCVTMMFVGGVACDAASFVEKGSVGGTILVMLGKCFIAGAYNIIFYYTAEMFPTVVRNSAVGFCAMSAKISGALTPWITLLDTWDLRLPMTVFGIVAIVSALLTLLLPETLGTEMPQTLKDGENFQKGDNGYKSIWSLFMRKCKKGNGE